MLNTKRAKNEERKCIHEDVLTAISDNTALVLFNTIALAEGSPIQIRKIGLTTRQYYSKLSRLTRTGLVTVIL